MQVTIKVIPNHQQRYPTVGDWVWEGDNLTIFISDMRNWRYEMLVAFHELAECLLCKQRNISQSEVDLFDIAYEAKRKGGDESEPGDDPNAPYYREHQFATKVEKMLAKELGVKWSTYNRAVESL